MFNLKKLFFVATAVLTTSHCGRGILKIVPEAFSSQSIPFIYYWTSILYFTSFLCFWAFLLYGGFVYRSQLRGLFVDAKNFLADHQTPEIRFIDSVMCLMFMSFWLPAFFPLLTMFQSLVVGMMSAVVLFVYQIRRQRTSAVHSKEGRH